MKPEQDKACVGNISRQRWNLRVLTFLFWTTDWIRVLSSDGEKKGTHQWEWSCIWGSIPVNDEGAVPVPLLMVIIIIAGSVTVAGRKDFGNPTGAPGWCSPPSPPSPPPRQPPSSRLQNNFDDWRILHFHQIQRITLLVRILFLHFNLFTFSQFHWKISSFPIIFNHEYGSSSHLRRISPESSCL